MIRRPPKSTPLYSTAASGVYKRQVGASAGVVRRERPCCGRCAPHYSSTARGKRSCCACETTCTSELEPPTPRIHAAFVVVGCCKACCTWTAVLCAVVASAVQSVHQRICYTASHYASHWSDVFGSLFMQNTNPCATTHASQHLWRARGHPFIPHMDVCRSSHLLTLAYQPVCLPVLLSLSTHRRDTSIRTSSPPTCW